VGTSTDGGYGFTREHLTDRKVLIAIKAGPSESTGTGTEACGLKT
jgi:hypothetical protein